MKTWTIYKLTNTVNGKCYIGQTCDFKRRINVHRLAKSKQGIHCAIRIHGWHNFAVDVLLDNLSKAEGNYWESLFIKTFDSKRKGYNDTDGGDGVDSETARRTQNTLLVEGRHNFQAIDHRERQRQWLSNPENRKLMSESQIRRFANPENRKKQSERIKAAWQDPEKRERMIQASRGRKFTDKSLERKLGMHPLSLHIEIMLYKRAGWSERKISRETSKNTLTIRKYRDKYLYKEPVQLTLF